MQLQSSTALDYLPSKATLSFLSVVDTSQIPLHIQIGPTCEVSTTRPETERWFEQILLGGQAKEDDKPEGQWWYSGRFETTLGIIAALNNDSITSVHNGLRVTEILFFASRSPNAHDCPPTPPRSSQEQQIDTFEELTLQLNAVLLCSDRLYSTSFDELTPPPSPTSEQPDRLAYFLPGCHPSEDVQRPTLSRKRVADTFEADSQRRKRSKKSTNDLIVTSTTNEPLGRTRQPSATVIQTRALSRSPSVTSSISISRRSSHHVDSASHSVPVPPSKRSASGLSHVQNTTGVEPNDCSKDDLDPHDGDVETKNKAILSRLVMAGMRLHGLSQSKSRPSRKSSTAPSTAEQSHFDEERVNDEEYKLIYHTAFKGACFAFRNHISTVNLRPYTEVLRETVDRLLILYCSDPLLKG